jgi:hypothetical protein
MLVITPFLVRQMLNVNCYSDVSNMCKRYAMDLLCICCTHLCNICVKYTFSFHFSSLVWKKHWNCNNLEKVSYIMNVAIAMNVQVPLRMRTVFVSLEDKGYVEIMYNINCNVNICSLHPHWVEACFVITLMKGHAGVERTGP